MQAAIQGTGEVLGPAQRGNGAGRVVGPNDLKYLRPISEALKTPQRCESNMKNSRTMFPQDSAYVIMM